MRTLCLTLVLLGVTVNPGRAPSGEPAEIELHAGDGPNPWTHLNVQAAEDEALRFAIVADRTGGHQPGVFEDAVTAINRLRPELTVSVGDLTERGRDEEWAEVTAMTARLDGPFFYVPGNHDLYSGGADTWRQRFGRSYYHFVYKNVLFLCLNTNDYDRDAGVLITDAQVDYVRAALAENPDVRWTFVFQHHPLWNYGPEHRGLQNQWLDIEQLLQGRNYTAIAGHEHKYHALQRFGMDYITLCTTGGYNPGGGAQVGMMHHVTWVTVDGNSPPTIVNIEVDAISGPAVNSDAWTAQYTRLVESAGALALPVAPPAHAEADASAETIARIRLVNPTDRPMTFEAVFAPQLDEASRPGWLAELPLVSRTVGPGESEVLEIPIRCTPETPWQTAPPLLMSYTCTIDVPGRPPAMVQRVVGLRPTPAHQIGRAGAELAVDGSVDDWDGLQPLEHAPARMGVAADNRFVYVGLRVFDDALQGRPIGRPWTQDGIELRIDARPEPARSAGVLQHEAYGRILVVGAVPDQDPGAIFTAGNADLAEGLQVACRPRPGDGDEPAGYDAEFAIPMAYFEAVGGEAWDALRLNVVINDRDEPAGPVGKHWWQPDWRGDGAVVGSGTFIRPE